MGFVVILLLAVALLLLALPVVLAARMVGARRAGFGWALLAILVQQLVSFALKSQGLGGFTEVVLLVLASSAVYALVLDTTLLRGFAIGILTVVLILLFTLALATLLGALGVAAVL